MTEEALHIGSSITLASLLTTSKAFFLCRRVLSCVEGCTVVHNAFSLRSGSLHR